MHSPKWGSDMLLLNDFGEELVMIVFSMWRRSVPVWHRSVYSIIVGLWQSQWLWRLYRWTKLQWVHDIYVLFVLFISRQYHSVLAVQHQISVWQIPGMCFIHSFIHSFIQLVYSVVVGLWQWQWLLRLLQWTKLQWVHDYNVLFDVLISRHYHIWLRWQIPGMGFIHSSIHSVAWSLAHSHSHSFIYFIYQ